MPLAPSYSSIASTSTPSLTSTPSDALSLSTPPLDPFASFSSFATYEELPTYEPLQRSAPRPCTARARNLLSALDTLRLPPAPHKPSALVRHLALFNEMVSQLEGEGVALAPVEKGWALVQSCPALALMDAWFVVSPPTFHLSEKEYLPPALHPPFSEFQADVQDMR